MSGKENDSFCEIKVNIIMSVDYVKNKKKILFYKQHNSHAVTLSLKSHKFIRKITINCV